VRHDLGLLRHTVNQFIRHPVGVRGQEADALQPVQRLKLAHQRGQGGIGWFIFAVAIHNLTEQGDLTYALFHQRPRLCQNLLRWAADFNAAAVGDDAVGAGM